MKKIFIAATMTIAAIAFTACGNSNSKADLKSDIDSLSYAIGIDQSQGVKQYLMQMQIDTAYMDDFVKGLNEGAKASDDKKKAAYNAGIAIGMQTAMMQKGINRQLFGNDSTKSISMKNFLAGFAAGATGKDQKMTIEQARTIEQMKAQAIQAKAAEDTYGPNKKKGEEFMKKIAKTAGVQALGQGVYYKSIKKGTGETPKKDDVVKVNYEGKTVEGKVFDTTTGKQPANMPVGNVIPGFTEALTHMHVGDVWEVYIPYTAAYKAQSPSPDIKPFSALIFKVELLGIEKSSNTPAAPAVKK
jgi:FKBP-type peptidyl-prolyl cis-trans isomerase